MQVKVGAAFSVCHTFTSSWERRDGRFISFQPGQAQSARLGLLSSVINKGQSHCWELMTVLHTIETSESNYRVLGCHWDTMHMHTCVLGNLSVLHRGSPTSGLLQTLVQHLRCYL